MRPRTALWFGGTAAVAEIIAAGRISGAIGVLHHSMSIGPRSNVKWTTITSDFSREGGQLDTGLLIQEASGHFSP